MKTNILFLILIMGLASCDDASTKTLNNQTNNVTNNDTPLPPSTQAAWIVAAVGGEIVLDDGARLEIPAGVLTEDATVILSRVTCEGYVQGADFDGCLYEVEASVALTGRLSVQLPTNVADGPGCLMAMDDEGWRCEADSAAETGSVRATASAPGAFVLRAPATVGQVTPNAGTDLPFEICGGDLYGEWKLALAFGTVEALTGFTSETAPRYGNCEPFHHYEGETFFINETLTVTAGGEDGAVATYDTTGGFSVYTHSATTQVCLNLNEESCPSPCVMTAGVCGCLIRDTAGNVASGKYLYEDTEGQLILDQLPLEYCVLGDTLTVRRTSPLGTTVKMYSRQ